jgi:transposase
MVIGESGFRFVERFNGGCEKRLPKRPLLRRINPIVGRILEEFRQKLQPFYSELGRPSVDPELMIRMLIIGYCYGIRFERRLCEDAPRPPQS